MLDDHNIKRERMLRRLDNFKDTGGYLTELVSIYGVSYDAIEAWLKPIWGKIFPPDQLTKRGNRRKRLTPKQAKMVIEHIDEL